MNARHTNAMSKARDIAPEDDHDAKPFVQRVVSAADTERPATTAAPSVFGIAGTAVKKLRVNLPPLDLSALVIRDDVPLPRRNRGNDRASPYKELLAKLKPGQSVELGDGYAKPLASAAKKMGVKMSFRKLGDGRTGCWRLEG